MNKPRKTRSRFFVILHEKSGHYYNRRHHHWRGIADKADDDNSTFLTTSAEATKYVSKKGAEKAILKLIQAEYDAKAEIETYNATYAKTNQGYQRVVPDPEPAVKAWKECVVQEVQGNPLDCQIEFLSHLGYIDRRRPAVGTKLKKGTTYCQNCGMKIPAHVPYFGGKFKTDICIICMEVISKEVNTAYKEFAEQHPEFIENYRHQLMIRRL